MPDALSHLRIVEFGGDAAVAMCGRWLAAFGAEVIKVEPPGGDSGRSYNPLGLNDAARPATGSLSRFLDGGKKSIVLDPTLAGDDLRLRRLVETADLVLHDGRERARLAAIASVAEGRVLEVALTSFPETGPYADYAGAPNVLLALGGFQHLTGDPGREPLPLPGHQPQYLTGLYGVIGALAGLLRRREGGPVSKLSVSALEVLGSLHQLTFSLYLQAGRIRSRHGNRWEGLYTTMLPCSDGWVALAASGQENWERLCIMMDRPELTEDERFLTGPMRVENSAALDVIVSEWLKGESKDELFRRAQEDWRMGWGALMSFDEVLESPQSNPRGFWATPDPGGPKVPGFPAVMGETQWQVRPAPAPGEHNGEIDNLVKRNVARPVIDTIVTSDAKPLAGVRVLDLTRVWAGPLCARILADLGADVVRIERPQPPEMAAGPYAASGGLRELYRNRRSLAIDLDTEAGRDVVRRMVKDADIVVENFSSRVMPNFGLDFEELRKINPALVMLSMPAYGAKGPYGAYIGAGPSIEPVTGLPNLLGYSESELRGTAIAYTDAVAGVSGAALLMIALTHARRTGVGQWVDLSQMEAAVAMLGEYYLAYQEAGFIPPRAANSHPMWCPYGAYRCAGEDQWLSVAVRGGDEWRALCHAIGRQEMAADATLATAAGRMSNKGAVEMELSAWTRARSKFEAMALLQQAGVPAGAILDGREVLEDPQMAHSGYFVRAGGRGREPDLVPASPILVDGVRRTDWLMAPRCGEDSVEVLRDVVGMGEEEIAALVADGIVRPA